MPALWDRQEVQAGSAVILRQRSLLGKAGQIERHGVTEVGFALLVFGLLVFGPVFPHYVPFSSLLG